MVEDYSIRLEPGRVILRGIGRLSGTAEYKETRDLLMTAATAAPDGLEIDCSDLVFLNSSGISTLTIFVLEVRDNRICSRLVFRSNAGKHTWQAKWLRNLRKIWSGVQVAERAA